MTSDKENAPSFPIGTTIRKKFGNEWYTGVVDAYEEPWYHVTYTDGDHEDMTPEEVQQHILKRKILEESPRQKKRNKEQNEMQQTLEGRFRQAKAKMVSYNEDDFDSDYEDDNDKESFGSKKKIVDAVVDVSDFEESSIAESEELDMHSDDTGESDVPPRLQKGEKKLWPIFSKPGSKQPTSTIKVKPARNPPAKRSAVSKTKEPNEHSASDATNRILKSPYNAGDGLAPLSEPQDMFDDMISKLSKEVDLQCLHNKEVRVATMCSGTESPLLAADMISNALLQHHNVRLNWCHVFSCEIEPFKQAYIERNFQPPLLFRDIRELGGEQATTAYGALRNVPLDVDILIAGTSCVDYSNLNNSKKEMDELGESGQTFHG